MSQMSWDVVIGVSGSNLEGHLAYVGRGGEVCQRVKFAREGSVKIARG